MKVLYLPGGGTSRANYPYGRILRKIQTRGHETVFCPITWGGTNIHDWVDEVRPVYQGCDAAQTILVGFSFGAMASLLLAAERPPAGLVLCSLSPYFAEDLPFIPGRCVNRLNPRRRAAFWELSFSNFSSKITCPTKLIMASREKDWGQRRTRIASYVLPDAEAFMAPNVGHSPAKWPYIQTLAKAFDSLRTDLPLA